MFANTLEDIMNSYGADGWEYQRTDTLPCEERSGLTGKSTSFQNMLIFRRALVNDETVLLIEDQKVDTEVLVETKPVVELSDPIVEPDEAVAPSPEPPSGNKAVSLGGANRIDPGKTVSAPDVAAQ